MKCPVCRASYRPSAAQPGFAEAEGRGQRAGGEEPLTYPCRRCGADLTSLIQLHDRATYHYRKAIALFQSANYPAAQAELQRAIALHRTNADYYVLNGQLHALQGDFGGAIAAWKQAQSFDPKHPYAAQILTNLQHFIPTI